MGAKMIFTCNICKKEQIFSGPDALNDTSPWRAIPNNDKKNPRSPWENKWGKFDHLAHEWVCSIECMKNWTDLDPKHRVIFIPDESYYGDSTWTPCYIIRSTKKYI